VSVHEALPKAGTRRRKMRAIRSFFRGSSVPVLLLLCCLVAHLLLLAPTRAIAPAVAVAEEEEDLFAWQPCPEVCSSTVEAKEEGARIFYLILIHNERTMNDALHLFRAIRDPRNIIFIHYDTAAEYLMQDEDHALFQEMETCACGAKIRIESVYSVEWSKWSMNLPTLYGLQVAAEEYTDQWDVFINLSGDTLPVYTTDVMAELLEQLSSYNFVTSRSCETDLVPTSVYHFPRFWHKRRHYTGDERETDPVLSVNADTNMTVKIHFGSQWVILQQDFVRWLVQELHNDLSWPSQLRDYLQASGKLMTDETFIPTVLMHAPQFADTLPVGPLVVRNANTTTHTIHHVRYERMDEHYPSAFGVFVEDQHYQVPDSLLDVLDQPRIWGPYFLGTYDLGGLKLSGALFARKISALVDPNLVRLLPVDHIQQIPDIRWPHEVSVTAKPDWSSEKVAWKEMMDRQRKQTDDVDDEEL